MTVGDMSSFMRNDGLELFCCFEFEQKPCVNKDMFAVNHEGIE